MEHNQEVRHKMCSDCRVVETEMAAEGHEDTGLQVIRVHPETEVREITV